MINEYIPGTLLHNFCTALGSLGEDCGHLFMSQIVDALFYMHEKDITHRDLHTGNIMVGPGLQIKLIDFGNAATIVPMYISPRIHHDDLHNQTWKKFMSPELIL